MNPLALVLATAAWAWLLGLVLISRDWSAVAATVRQHPRTLVGYALLTATAVAACPIWWINA